MAETIKKGVIKRKVNSSDTVILYPKTTADQVEGLGNGILTIQSNGASSGTFTANQSGNTTINLKTAEVIDVTDGVTAAIKTKVTNNPSIILKYETYYYMPQYYDDEYSIEIPSYYNCFEGDGNTFHWLQIDWENLEVGHHTKSYISSHQSIKALNTTATTAQSTSSSESINGSGTITLHKVAKTGTYSDLIGTPTIPTSFNLVDDILDGSANKYAPYASSAKAAGRLYSGTTNPTNTTRLNYDGYFYATKLYSGGAEVKTTDNNYYHTPVYTSSSNSALKLGTGTGVNDMYIPAASSSQSGIVTTGDQTFAGNKTFTSSIGVTNSASGSSLRTVQIYDHTISFYANSTEVGIQYDDTSSSDGIRICGANLVSKDGDKDLGTSTYQWRNLYLSGNLSDGTNSVSVAQIGKVKSVNNNTPDANGNVSISIPTSFNLTDNILDGSANKYEPYSATTATSTWVGTDGNAGKLYLGTQDPSKTTRLNYNGYLYATKLYSGGAEVKTTDNNYYPTSFSWANGTTAGPTGSLTGTGMSAVSFAAIPSASDTQSGIVNTTAQTFAGKKTFNDELTSYSHLRVFQSTTESTTNQKALYITGKTLQGFGSNSGGCVKLTWPQDVPSNTTYTLTLPKQTGTVAITDDIPDGFTLTDDILDGSKNKYAPYASESKAAGRLYLGTTNPTNSTRLNYDGYFYAKKLYSEGSEVLTGHQSIKTLKTDNTSAQTPSSSETIAGSGTINLHKVAKTGTYSDLIGTPTLGTAAAKDYTTSVTSGSASLVTSGAVYSAISDLPKAMIFRGTLGTGGTITSLPTASASVEGDTYKVITAGTYASQSAKVGDVFICGLPTGSSTYSWILIPSGDEPSGTVTSIATGAGLTGGTITSSGTIKANLVNETKSTNAASYTAGGSSKFYAVQIDKNDKLGVYVPWSDNNDNYYHSTGSWSGTTYTATANGGAPALAFTLPDATTSAKGVLALNKDNLNTMINQLDTGSSTPVDADYYISQYVSGGTTTTTYHRRPMSALWSYVKGKADSVYAPISHASSATTYGVGTTSNYGHVKLATGDMNGAAHVDGVAVSKNHTHSQYVTSSGVTSITINTSGTGISVNSTAAITSTGTRTITLDSSAEGNRAANKVVIAKAAGQINSEKYAVTSSGTAKATMQYNSTEDCIEFIFV